MLEFTHQAKARSRRWIGVAAYFAAYLATDHLALSHGGEGIAIYSWNASAAISLGILVRFGVNWCPLVIMGPLLACLLGGVELGEMLPRTLGEAIVCFLAAFLLRSRPEQRLELGRLRNIFAFFATAIAAALIIALVTGLRMFYAAVVGPWMIISAFSELALSHLVAILTISPLIIVSRMPKFRFRWRLALSVETILQMAALGIIAWEVFGRFVNQEIHCPCFGPKPSSLDEKRLQPFFLS